MFVLGLPAAVGTQVTCIGAVALVAGQLRREELAGRRRGGGAPEAGDDSAAIEREVERAANALSSPSLCPARAALNGAAAAIATAVELTDWVRLHLAALKCDT